MLLRTDSDRTRVDGSTTVLSVEFSQEHFESECDFLSVCRALYTCLDAVILLWHQEDCIGFIWIQLMLWLRFTRNIFTVTVSREYSEEELSSYRIDFKVLLLVYKSQIIITNHHNGIWAQQSSEIYTLRTVSGAKGSKQTWWSSLQPFKWNYHCNWSQLQTSRVKLRICFLKSWFLASFMHTITIFGGNSSDIHCSQNRVHYLLNDFTWMAS